MISTARIKLPPCTCSYSARLFSTSANSLAAYNFTSLKCTRSILSINGIDSVKFLQGLISNDVKRISNTGERLLYAAMLKADGRMLHDVFISSSESPIPSSPNSFYIDHASTDTNTLRTYLKRHILRSKVKLGKVAEERTIYAAWRTTGKEEGTKEELEEANEWFEKNEIGKDVRNDEMGWRWSTSSIEPILPLSSSFKEVPSSHHHLHRLLNAVPENPIDWPTLPLEGNLDYMNGVDYKKGCYVGQELTARTHHRGVVRKRGVVLRLFREGDEVPTSILPPNETALPSTIPSKYPLPSPQSTLTRLGSSTTSRARARPSGKLGSSLSITTSSGLETVLAFGSVRLEHIEEGDENSAVFIVKEPVVEVEGGSEVVGVAEEVKVLEKDEGRWLAKAFIPEWIMEKKKEEDARKADDE